MIKNQVDGEKACCITIGSADQPGIGIIKNPKTEKKKNSLDKTFLEKENTSGKK